MQQPRQEHMDAAHRTVRYLEGCPCQGILLRADYDIHLTGWCDSNRASCIGWLVFLGSSPISWKTKKQHTVSRSFIEVEYRSMVAITSELKWLKALLDGLGVAHPRAMTLFCDNKSALNISQNPFFHERMQETY